MAASSGLSPHQQRVLRSILRIGRRRGESPMEIKAAVETGLVESGLRNLRHGDADSLGWRQERASLYRNPLNLRASINRFFDETSAVQGRYSTAGDLAAAVQRPAAQYRGRYAQRSGEADQLITRAGFSGRTAPVTPGVPLAGTSRVFDRAGYEQAQRRALLAGFLSRSRGTGSLLFRSGLLSTGQPDRRDFTSVLPLSVAQPQRPFPSRPGGLVVGGGQAGRALAEAAKRLGVGEVGSSNRGRRLDQWQRRFGMVGQPWCGIFVGISLKAAGVRGVAPSIASVAATIADARAGRNGFEGFYGAGKARQGDVFTIGSATHMGLVERNNGDGTVTTIEGNTTNGRVERKRRRISELSGVARPRYGRG